MRKFSLLGEKGCRGTPPLQPAFYLGETTRAPGLVPMACHSGLYMEWTVDGGTR